MPFNKNELNEYIKIFKPVYFQCNYDLIYIYIYQYGALTWQILKIYNNNSNKIFNVCRFIIKKQ